MGEWVCSERSEDVIFRHARLGDELRWTCDGEGYSSWFVTELWEGTRRAMCVTVARERAAGRVMVVEYVPA